MLRKISVGLFLVLAACGSAKLIQRTESGGTYELQGDRGKAMEQATAEMNAHCGGPGSWRVTQEGEEAIGTDTFTREDTAVDTTQKESRSGRRSKSSTDATTVGQTSTRTATAYRIHYACNSAGGAPPPPAPGGAPPPPPEGAPPPPGY